MRGSVVARAVVAARAVVGASAGVTAAEFAECGGAEGRAGGRAEGAEIQPRCRRETRESRDTAEMIAEDLPSIMCRLSAGHALRPHEMAHLREVGRKGRKGRKGRHLY